MGKAERFWEIDFLRGAAIVAMVTFHALWDLDLLGMLDIDLYSGPSLLFALSIGTTFLFVVGISLTLSHWRRGGESRDHVLARGAKIFILGMVVSAATFLVLGDQMVIFGVLHCIGVSVVLAYPFLRYRYLNLALGVALVLAGVAVSGIRVEDPYLIWMGLRPSGFHTADYFPLLPWFGVVLLGVFTGNTLYSNHRRGFSLPDLSRYLPVRSLCGLGRYSLMIYLVHQPLLLGVLYLL
ncbi:MAG: heparan-alpha-glucosaminide N-acetyltransferase [Methanomassiliicoccales archaeon]